jgi:hypothetical protein
MKAEMHISMKSKDCICLFTHTINENDALSIKKEQECGGVFVRQFREVIARVGGIYE